MVDETRCPNCESLLSPTDTFCGKCGTRLDGDTIEKDSLIGTVVGDRFAVDRRLGAGGMGVVYKAAQTAIGRPVALKVLHPALLADSNIQARFYNEAAASSRLNHPNTITIFDFGQTADGALYIAMEYVDGRSLDEEIAQAGAIDWRRACQIGVQICGSLQDAHHHNIVHRDLKPENIMLFTRGLDHDVVKVLDFGIAKMLESGEGDRRKALTQTGMVFGTPQYMSPEQVRGEKVDGRSDVYSLGVIFYEMLTGELPFTAENPMGILTKHLVDEPPAFNAVKQGHDVPAELERLVFSMLAKDPDQRPQTMGELIKPLRKMADGHVTERQAKAAPKQTRATRSKARRKHPAVMWIVIAIVTVLGIGGALAYVFVFDGKLPGSKPARRRLAVPTGRIDNGPPKVAKTPPSDVEPKLPPLSGELIAPVVDPDAEIAGSPRSNRPKGTKDDPQPPAEGSQEAGEPSPAPDTSAQASSDEGGDPEGAEPTEPEAPPGEPTVEPPPQEVAEETPEEPKPEPKPLRCSYKAVGSGEIALTVKRRLEAKGQRIASCVQKNPASESHLLFQVQTNGRTRVTPVGGRQSPLDGCLRGLFQAEIKRAGGVKVQVDVVPSQKEGVVESCRVTVEDKGRTRRRPTGRRPADLNPGRGR